MMAMLDFATVAIFTLFAVSAAAALYWLGLRAAFALMEPATARRVTAPPSLAPTATRVARASSFDR